MGTNECKKIKELMHEDIDGMLGKSAKTGLFEHLRSCSACNTEYTELKLISGAVRSIEFIEPDYLEAKINQAVSEAQNIRTGRVFAKKLVPAFGLSFAAVFAAAVFIIYNSSANKAIQTAAVPEIKKEIAIASVKPEAVKVQVPEKAAIPEIKAEPKYFVKNDAPVYENRMVKAPAREAAVQQASANYVPASENRPVFSAAKDELTPTPGAGILDRERAVVANNVVNPSRGMAANIRYKVDEPSRVKITVYDKTVRVVAVLLDEEKQPGIYETPWYGRTDGNIVCRDGVYFITIQIGKQVIKRNVVISKNF